MKKKNNIHAYFAHSKKDYNTEREKKALKFIRSKYSNVLCPNNDIGKLKDFEAYLKIVKWADLVIAMETEDRFITIGVFKELETAINNFIMVMVIRKYGKTFKLIPVDNIILCKKPGYFNSIGKLILKKHKK